MWFFWKEVRVVKTTLIRDLTFFKLTHHEVKEARRRRRKKKTTTTTSTVYGTLKPATSDKLHYCRHVRRARHRATEKHSEWCVQMHLKTKRKNLGGVWRLMMKLLRNRLAKRARSVCCVPPVCSPLVFLKLNHIAQGWNDFKNQLSNNSTKQLKPLFLKCLY